MENGNIGLIDDSADMHYLLRQFLEMSPSGNQLSAEAYSPEEAEALIEQLRSGGRQCDIYLVDRELGGPRPEFGIELSRRLRQLGCRVADFSSLGGENPHATYHCPKDPYEAVVFLEQL